MSPGHTAPDGPELGALHLLRGLVDVANALPQIEVNVLEGRGRGQAARSLRRRRLNQKQQHIGLARRVAPSISKLFPCAAYIAPQPLYDRESLQEEGETHLLVLEPIDLDEGGLFVLVPHPALEPHDSPLDIEPVGGKCQFDEKAHRSSNSQPIIPPRPTLCPLPPQTPNTCLLTFRPQDSSSTQLQRQIC